MTWIKRMASALGSGGASRTLAPRSSWRGVGPMPTFRLMARLLLFAGMMTATGAVPGAHVPWIAWLRDQQNSSWR